MHGELFGNLRRLRLPVDQHLHVAAEALSQALEIIGSPVSAADPDAWRYFQTHSESAAPFTQGDDELLTVKQVATRIGWSEQRVYSAVHAGVLPRADDGWAVRISAAELREFVENLSAKDPEQPRQQPER